MTKHTSYTGYESFNYLDTDEDFIQYEMPDSPHQNFYELPISEEEEERVNRISEDFLILSIHDHALYLPKSPKRDCREYFNQNRIATAYDGLAESNLDGVFDNFVNGYRRITQKGDTWKWDSHIEDIIMRKSDIAHQDLVVQAETVDDIRKAHEDDQVAWIPALEGAPYVENELDRFDLLYGLGVRMSGLAMNDTCYLSAGMIDNGPQDGGLTYFGQKAVRRMNKIGMAIDLPHSSDQTILDVCDISEKPVFLSHVGARSLWENQKTKPDECLKAVADTGGVVGIGAATTMSSNKRDDLSFEAIMDHFKYIEDLIGIEHVTFGTDLIYGDLDAISSLDHSDPTKYQKLYGSDEKQGFNLSEDATAIQGLENPTEAWNNIVRWLVKEGYSDNEIEMILSGNALTALEEVWH